MVMYPCSDNELLNFVGIHPDAESHTVPSAGEPAYLASVREPLAVLSR
jgi:hypothetical protein